MPLLAGCALRSAPPLPAEVIEQPPPPPPMATLTVFVQPEDAVITLDDREGIEGAVPIGGLSPGRHDLRVERAGFEPVARTLLLQPDIHLTTEVALPPLWHDVHLRSHPGGATMSLLREGGGSLEVTAPWDGELPAGAWTVHAEIAAHDPDEASLFVDGEADHFACLDPPGQLVDCVRVLECGPGPKAVRFSPDGGELWTALLGGPPSVQVYDTDGWQMTSSVDLAGHGTVELEFSDDGSIAWASQMKTASIWELDRVTKEPLRQLKSRSRWSKVIAKSADRQRLFLSNWLGDNVSEIDLATGEVVRKLRTVDTPRGLWPTPDGRQLYVAGFGDGRLDRIDLETGGRETVYNGAVLRHLVGDAERGRLYISDMRRGRICVLDLQTGEVSILARTEANPNTIDLSPDGRVLAVSCRSRNNPASYHLPGPDWGTVLILDALTGEVLDAIVGGNQPTGLDISADGRWLAVSDILDNRIRVYGLPTTEELLAGSGGRRDVYRDELRK